MLSLRLKQAVGIAMAALAVALVGFAVLDSLGIGTRSTQTLPVAIGASSPTLVADDPAVTTIVADDVFGEQAAPIETAPLDTTPLDTTPLDTTPIALDASPGCQILRVMPLGDSMTAYPDSYRGPLYQLLYTQSVNVDFVGSVKYEPEGGGDPDAEGHGGYTIGPDSRIDSEGKPGNLAANVGKWIPAAKPDVIILTIGTNDMAGSDADKAAAPGKLKALVATLQRLAPKAKIVISDLPPSGYYQRGYPAQVALDAAAKSLGTAKPDDNLFYAPTRDELEGIGFDESVDIKEDKTHFTTSGGQKFANALAPTVIDAIVAASRERTC